MNLTARHPAGNLVRVQVDTNKSLGRGATAIVYPAVMGGAVYAAKIYHQDQKFNSAKILAMLENAPANVRIQIAGGDHSQLAWPIAILCNSQGQDVGYLMPMVDLEKSFSLDHFYDQTLLRKLKSPSESALSFKLEIARNLCMLVADLHDHNHCFIDMKPQNIRVMLGSHVVTLVDCDGFSIAAADGKRYPAELVSSDYVAPEAYRNTTLPAQLSEAQDRYALAVILFQLLNGGTHPFQGILKASIISAQTNDEKAAQGLYPHGSNPDPRISPRPQSIHFLLDDGLRALFDSAFTGPPDARPSARDWAHKIDTLLRSKSLSRCDKEPYDVGHMRFADKGCPACYLASLRSVAPPKTVVDLTPVSRPSPSIPQTAQSSPYRQNSIRTVSAKSYEGIWTFAAICVVLGLALLFGASNNGARPFKNYTNQDLCSAYYSVTTQSERSDVLREVNHRGYSAYDQMCNSFVTNPEPVSKQSQSSTVPSAPVNEADSLAKLYSLSNEAEVRPWMVAAEVSSWSAANDYVISQMGRSDFRRTEQNTIMFFPKVKITPFRGLRIFLGSHTCEETTTVTSVCTQEAGGLSCFADIFDQQTTQQSVCISAFLR